MNRKWTSVKNITSCQDFTKHEKKKKRREKTEKGKRTEKNIKDRNDERQEIKIIIKNRKRIKSR